MVILACVGFTILPRNNGFWTNNFELLTSRLVFDEKKYLRYHAKVTYPASSEDTEFSPV
jgi:hypothetical protein